MITLSIFLTIIFTSAFIFLLVIGAPATIIAFVGGDLLIAILLIVVFIKIFKRKK